MDGTLEPIEYSSPKGTLRMSEPAPGVLLTVARGRATVGAVFALIRFSEQMVAAGRRLLVFHDWENLSGYDLEAKQTLTEWSRRIIRHWDASHILFRSQLIAMAVAVENLAVRGKATSYGSRKKWEAALATACVSRNVRSPASG
jgi:hypothetical protein